MDTVLAKASTVTTPEMYKEFYKSYYKEKMRVFLIVATVIGAALIAFGLYSTTVFLNIYVSSATIAAGIVLIIYPRFAYRRPYKSVKDNKIKMSFEFYKDRFREITESAEEFHFYSDMKKVSQTGNYIYIFHTAESASVVDKSQIKLLSPDELYSMLESAVNGGNFY